MCPVCEGREPGLFESLCQKHFDELPEIPVEEIRAAMEKGRKDAEAARRANRGRRLPCPCQRYFR